MRIDSCLKRHTAAYHNSEYSYHLTNSPIFLNGITILKRNPFWKPKGIDLHIFLELIEECTDLVRCFCTHQLISKFTSPAHAFYINLEESTEWFKLSLFFI